MIRRAAHKISQYEEIITLSVLVVSIVFLGQLDIIQLRWVECCNIQQEEERLRNPYITM